MGYLWLRQGEPEIPFPKTLRQRLGGSVRPRSQILSLGGSKVSEGVVYRVPKPPPLHGPERVPQSMQHPASPFGDWMEVFGRLRRDFYNLPWRIVVAAAIDNEGFVPVAREVVVDDSDLYTVVRLMQVFKRDPTTVHWRGFVHSDNRVLGWLAIRDCA